MPTCALLQAAQRIAACLCLLPTLAMSSAAEPGLRIDTAHSFAGFSVRAAWVKRIDGRFAHIEGVVRPDAQERYVLEVRVASGSVLMGRVHRHQAVAQSTRLPVVWTKQAAVTAN